MAEKRPSEFDMASARKIVAQHRHFVGPGGTMPENIALAVAEGIALGRQQGIEMAAAAIGKLKGTSDA